MNTLSAVEQASIDDQLLAELLEGVDDGTDDDTVLDLSGEVEESADGLDILDSIGITEDDLLESAVRDIAMKDAKAEIYAGQESTMPTDAVPPESLESAAKVKKAKKEKEPKAPKPLRATSSTHKPGDLLKLKLGEKAGDYLTFDMKDAELTVDEIMAKQDAFISRMNDYEAIADKVREKITMLLTWMTTGGTLNEVLKRSFIVLAQEGQLTSGEKGNLQLNLLAKPYSTGTARSQASQIFMLMPELGITLKTRGVMVANPDSTLLPIINKMLGL